MHSEAAGRAYCTHSPSVALPEVVEQALPSDALLCDEGLDALDSLDALDLPDEPEAACAVDTVASVGAA